MNNRVLARRNRVLRSLKAYYWSVLQLGNNHPATISRFAQYDAAHLRFMKLMENGQYSDDLDDAIDRVKLTSLSVLDQLSARQHATKK